VTAVLSEFAEYFTFIRDSPELRRAYTDTLGDLAFGLAASVLAAAFRRCCGREQKSHIRHSAVTHMRTFHR
jgi:hypothetical protein